MNDSNQQPYPPQPQPPSSKPWLKWVLLLIFVSLLSSGGIYFVLNQKSTEQPQPSVVQALPSPTPTPDPTANWKTYTDSVQGFLFKYPQDWSTRPHTLSNYSPFFESPDITYDEISGRNTKGSFVVAYWISENKTLDQLEQEAKAYRPPDQTDAPETINIARVTVNNEDALKVISSEAPGPLTLRYTFIRNGQAVYAACTYLEPDLQASTTCETILFTFKFLE